MKQRIESPFDHASGVARTTTLDTFHFAGGIALTGLSTRSKRQ